MLYRNLFVEQHDSNDCAAACLAMVSKFYGKDFSITKLRDVLGTDIQGTPLKGLVDGAKKLGYDAKLVSITKEVIHDKFTLPAICYVRNSFGAGHFVVLQKVYRKKVLILDPAIGVKKIKIDEFFEFFDGYIVFLYPNNGFKLYNNKEKSTTFKQFMALLKPQKKLFIYAIVASIFLTVLGIFSSLFNKVMMDEVLPYYLKDLLIAYSIGFGCVAIIRVILGAVRQHLVLYLSQRIDLPMMLSYFKHVYRLPINFFATRKVGDITTRFQDAYVIKNILTNAMLTLIIDILLAVVTAIIMILMSWQLFLVILAITVLSGILIYCYKGLYKKLNKKQMEQGARLNSQIIDTLKGIETVKVNAYEDTVLDKVENEYVKSLKIDFKQGFHSNIQSSFSQIITGIGNIVLMAMGIWLVIENKITIGTVLAFMTIAGYFMDPIGRLIELQLQIQEADISLKRLSEIYDVDEEVEHESQLDSIDVVDGDISLKNVSFRYGSRPLALNNITIDLPRGSKIALVGESGSGKTTVTKLLMKFYDFEQGEIFVNGKSIKDINAFSLRQNIGYVPQNIEMFSGTVIDNIKVGKPDATDEDVKYACEISGCSKFINRLPFGYQTFLDDTGGGLSGGEKQRIAIARALLKRPKFLILDEATSSLDFNTEREVFDLLFSKLPNTTILIIAHRLSTIKNCDMIYVFDKGKIVESGKHATLYYKRGFYYKMFDAQTGSGFASYRSSLSTITSKIESKGENEIEY